MFTQYLQEAFQVPLVIQLTDDEKALWRCFIVLVLATMLQQVTLAFYSAHVVLLDTEKATPSPWLQHGHMLMGFCTKGCRIP